MPGCRITSARRLMADEFDMSFFQGKPLDHGCFSPLSMMWPHQPQWPGAIVPLQVGVLQFPIPSAARCYKLGQSLRKAIESYPEDLKVALVATGGLVASGAWRTRRLQQHRLGRAVPRPDREGSGGADPHDAGRLCPARRHGRRRGHHVAGDARRAVGQYQARAPQLLPAVDDRHRHRRLRERGDRADGRYPERLSPPYRPSAGRRRGA